jgi:selenophosphate synthetase-related protein
MEKKSGRKFKISEGLNYPMARNLDNFIITLFTKEYEKLEQLCKKEKCSLEKIGIVL